MAVINFFLKLPLWVTVRCLMISLDHANLTTTPESDATDLARYFWDFVLLKGQCPTLRQIPVTWPHKKWGSQSLPVLN